MNLWLPIAVVFFMHILKVAKLLYDIATGIIAQFRSMSNDAELKHFSLSKFSTECRYVKLQSCSLFFTVL